VSPRRSPRAGNRHAMLGRWALIAVLVALAGASLAQGPTSGIFNLPDDVVQRVMAAVRNHLHEGRLPDGSTLPPAAPAQRQPELIPLDLARQAIETGMLSGLAQTCGVEWRRTNFDRLMARERGRRVHAEKALTYIDMLHGTAMRLAADEYKTCPA